VSKTRLNVHIDRLVLRGIDPGDQQALANGLQVELERVLSGPQARAALTRSRRTPVIRLGRLPMQPGLAGARALGKGVAQAIGKAMKP
jgi:hypothetical protein